MKNAFSSLIGLGIIAYGVYIIVLVVQTVFNLSDTTWSELSPHLIVVAVFVVILLIGHFFGDKEEETSTQTQPSPKATNTPAKPEINTYDPIKDKLKFGIYQQEFRTWWYDSDGDTHDHSTIYARLRFYEDGTVLGIRSSGVPKIENEDSFTMKGNWTSDKNEVKFDLKKTSDLDERIEIYIPEEDRRDMKYYGEIADDDSLIKAGNHQGTIKGNMLNIGNHTFSYMTKLKLIVTASESACDQLEERIKHHPLVIETFQNTGNWYTNGETGPEWFTIHITALENNEKDVEELVNQELSKTGESASNQFWDWA